MLCSCNTVQDNLTALMLASVHGQSKTVRQLILAGANKKIKDNVSIIMINNDMLLSSYYTHGFN